MNDNWYVLAICILSPKYVCIEKAMYYYTNKIPITQKGGRFSWMNQDIINEMNNYYANGLSYKKIGDLFGLSDQQISKYIKRKKVM